MTSCSNKGSIISFVFYNFILAKMYPICSAFCWLHYGCTRRHTGCTQAVQIEDITIAHSAMSPLLAAKKGFNLPLYQVQWNRL